MTALKTYLPKFFTILCFVAFVLFSNSTVAQAAIKHSETGKLVDIPSGTKIFYKLYSDSTLGTQISKEYGFLITTGDSSLVLDDEVEIPISDIKYLEIESKRLQKWRLIASPFLIGGLGFLTRGLTMGTAEGLESKNEETVPLYIASGGAVTAISSIPFFLRNKSFDISKSKWEIFVP